MIAFNRILTKAYFYTRNHKFLWFFGIFAGGSAFVVVYKLFNINVRGVVTGHDRHAHFLYTHPNYFAGAILLFLFFFVIFTAIGVISKTVIYICTATIDRKENITGQAALQKSFKKFWRMFLVTIIVEALIVIIAFWLFVPLAYLYYHGYQFRSLALMLAAIVIYLPVFVILSLVEVFAANFVALYDMHVRDALHSAFDLFSNHWQDSVAIMVLLWAVFSVLFFVSASLLGFGVILAYLLSVLLKSLLIPVFLIAKIVFALIVIAALIFVNTLLNTYTNVVWTLFFIEIVKSVPTATVGKKEAVPEPIS